jgi:CRISPR type III-B/RAMP module-associated protein Cmr5
MAPQKETQRRSLEQERAKFALAKVKGIAQSKDKFKTQLVKLPARLHTNGLGQTVAFYMSAGQGKPEYEICNWLGAWLKEDGNPYHNVNGALIDAITGQDAATYRAASQEARALANWLKRFAEAFLDGEGHD